MSIQQDFSEGDPQKGGSQSGEARRNQIDRYVNNLMSQKERTAFEQRMREHVELAESVHLHRDILEGIELYFTSELKQALKQSDEQKPKSRWKTYLAVAASILVAAGMAVAYYFFDQNGGGQDLYTTYYGPYPNVVAPVTRAADTSPLSAIMQLYESGRYADFIARADTYIRQEEGRQLVFYRGIAYLETGQPEQAVADFRSVIQAGEEMLLHPAYWYLGLSQLKLGREDEARQWFEQLRETESVWATQAQQILQDME